MKTTIALFVIPFTILSSCSISINDKTLDGMNPFSDSRTVDEAGPQESKSYDMNFDGIKVSTGIYAEVIKSNTEKIIVSAPKNLVNEVLVEKNGSDVYVHFKPNLNIRNSSVVKVTIYAKDFSSVSASSSGKILIKDKFTQDKMSVKVSSSGEVRGDLEANDFNIDVSSSGNFSGKIWAVDLNTEVSSSGDIELSGSSTNVFAKASSSGKLDASALSTKNADLQASSSGDVYMKVTSVLSAKASSSGDIKVTTSGRLQNQDIKESSGGSVKIN